MLKQVGNISNNHKGVIKQIKRDRKQLENNKEESEAIEKKNSDDIREDIMLLKATNAEFIEKIKLIETESLYKTDEDSETIVETEFISSFVNKHKIKVKNKNADEKVKCGQCDFVGKTEVERNKHINTKHPIQNVETPDDKSSGLEGIDDMFQIEYLEGEQVYACNICDEGFDEESEIRGHIVEVHIDIVTQIKERLEEEVKITVDESLGDLVLSKFGNHGNISEN